MQGLAMKIVRGRYPPLPGCYSAQVRSRSSTPAACSQQAGQRSRVAALSLPRRWPAVLARGSEPLTELPLRGRRPAAAAWRRSSRLWRSCSQQRRRSAPLQRKCCSG
eukprot:1038528-Prymnesium_polylepis.1